MTPLTIGEGKRGYDTGMPGVYINSATISAVEDMSGKKIKEFAGRVADCMLKITLDIGLSWQPTLYIGGDFKREGATIVGWGGAFPVQRLLANCGVRMTLSTDNRIPPAVLSSLVGKKIYRLSYARALNKETGKIQYATFNILMLADREENQARLVKEFQTSLKKGFPKNYHPEVLEQQTAAATEFPPQNPSTLPQPPDEW